MAIHKVSVQRTYVDEIVIEVEAETEAEAKNKAFAKAIPLAKKKSAWNHVRNYINTIIITDERV
jgi:hypothetical protein